MRCFVNCAPNTFVRNTCFVKYHLFELVYFTEFSVSTLWEKKAFNIWERFEELSYDEKFYSTTAHMNTKLTWQINLITFLSKVSFKFKIYAGRYKNPSHLLNQSVRPKYKNFESHSRVVKSENSVGMNKGSRPIFGVSDSRRKKRKWIKTASRRQTCPSDRKRAGASVRV